LDRLRRELGINGDFKSQLLREVGWILCRLVFTGVKGLNAASVIKRVIMSDFKLNNSVDNLISNEYILTVAN